jgi:hypothetical protein
MAEEYWKSKYLELKKHYDTQQGRQSNIMINAEAAQDYAARAGRALSEARGLLKEQSEELTRCYTSCICGLATDMKE